MTLIQRTILVSAVILTGCQNQVGFIEYSKASENIDINISAIGIGGISKTTPFNIQGIKDVFPEEYIISQNEYSSESEKYPVILVSQDEQLLLTITPAINQRNIHSVIVESAKVGPYRKYAIGMSYQKIAKDIMPGHCTPGQEEWSGKVICYAQSAASIRYIFNGEWQGPDSELPPQPILNSWPLYKLVWLVTNNTSP